MESLECLVHLVRIILTVNYNLTVEAILRDNKV